MVICCAPLTPPPRKPDCAAARENIGAGPGPAPSAPRTDLPPGRSRRRCRPSRSRRNSRPGPGTRRCPDGSAPQSRVRNGAGWHQRPLNPDVGAEMVGRHQLQRLAADDPDAVEHPAIGSGIACKRVLGQYHYLRSFRCRRLVGVSAVLSALVAALGASAARWGET